MSELAFGFPVPAGFWDAYNILNAVDKRAANHENLKRINANKSRKRDIVRRLSK